MVTRMIIDTDAGVDDAQAIMMALTHPNVRVEAITTVYGNVSLDKVIPNVCLTLDVMRKNVPVYAGADRPLVSEWFHADDVHGGDGLGDLPNRPTSYRRIEDEHAALALVRLANRYPGELTLVVLGPQTNVALATKLDPAFPSKLKQLVFMGGTISAMGNSPMAGAEFNTYCDPEATYIVLKSFARATMLSWETTLQHPVSWDRFDRLAATPTEAGRFFRAMTNRISALLKPISWAGGYLVPDPLAMAAAIEPDLVTSRSDYYVTVELQGAHTRGQTVLDYFGQKSQPANVDVINGLDMDRVLRLFQNMLA